MFHHAITGSWTDEYKIVLLYTFLLNMMKKYEQLDISGDVGLRVWGQTLEELFAHAAEGMGELVTDTTNVEQTEKKEISLVSENIESMFIQWLNELIFLFDAHGFLGKSFDVHIADLALHAQISGGIYNPEQNESRLLIKAATYHQVSIQKVNSMWEAAVIFDI